MDRPEWVTTQVDLDRASPSRVYDYLLGGCHNFEADRKAGTALLATNPEAATFARVNRAFLRRAVLHLLHAGVRQFIDVGSGIPAAGNVHEVVQSHDPAGRVVYVDVDPVAVAHTQAILAGNPYAAAVQADAREPDKILDSAPVRSLIDLTRPVGLLLVALLHFIPDTDRPGRIASTLAAPVPAGSFLAISHAAWPLDAGSDASGLVQAYRRNVAPVTMRDRDEIRAFFDGFDLLPPGLVPPGAWRPGAGEPERAAGSTPGVAGVAIKRRARHPA